MPKRQRFFLAFALIMLTFSIRDQLRGNAEGSTFAMLSAVGALMLFSSR